MLELNATKLSKGIIAFGKKRAESNQSLHELACSAVALASRDGRCDWMNELYEVLEPLAKDAFKAWVSPFADTFDTPEMTTWLKENEENKRPRWLKFKDGKFEIIAGTVGNRPTLAIITSISESFPNKFMLQPRAAAVAKTLAWDQGLVQRIKGIESAVLKAVKEHGANPAVRDRLNALVTSTHMFAVDAEKALSGLSSIEAPTVKTETQANPLADVAA